MEDTRKMLVIIDMQQGFINEHTEHLVQKIADFVEKNKSKFVCIVGTEYINHPNTACYRFEGWKSCMKDTPESFMIPELLRLVESKIEKDVYSCYSKYLKSYIDIREIDEVYLCGVNTGCCVLHSAFDMYNDLVSCYVIEDLCGSTSGPDSHKAAIQILQECITSDRVINSTQV